MSFRCKYCGHKLDEWSDEYALIHVLKFHPGLIEALVDYTFDEIIEEENEAEEQEG